MREPRFPVFIEAPALVCGTLVPVRAVGVLPGRGRS